RWRRGRRLLSVRVRWRRRRVASSSWSCAAGGVVGSGVGVDRPWGVERPRRGAFVAGAASSGGLVGGGVSGGHRGVGALSAVGGGFAAGADPGDGRPRG